ncbi:MAG: T9SS type A sorting domain-containing protein, partial [Ignavibacteria bacterium]|nr:T9SS type A sorting domain-containing protein [Ignavibacteria bacterium]
SPPPFHSLQQNYPNPFNSQTTIAYDLPTGSHVLLELYNAVGQHVMTLLDEFQNAGRRKELLEVGSLASGVYLYRLTAEPQSQSLKYSQTKKLLLIK